MRVLSMGEAMVEMAPDGQGKFTMAFAGDTLNTAWYLRQLLPKAHEVSYLSAVGTDEISARMVDFIESSGITTGEITRIADRSVGLYMILLDKGERRFSYWRSVSAAKLMLRGRSDLPVASGDLLYLSGITLAILSQEDRDTLYGLLGQAKARGATIAFDPNMRPRLWESAEVMRAEIMKGAALADIVLPSADEEALHFGDATPDVTLQRYVDAGAGRVVVKNGPGEIVASGPEGRLSFQPEPVAKVVDTTAAGDSFNAGFLAALLGGADLRAAIARGAAVAAQVVQAYGALVKLKA